MKKNNVKDDRRIQTGYMKMGLVLVLIGAGGLGGWAQSDAKTVPNPETEWRYPVVFEKSDSVCDAPYETYRLPMQWKEEEGKPLVFEAENATKISLIGAERFVPLDGACGGLVAWQILNIAFEFDTLKDGPYTMWFRCKGNPGAGICGPHHENVDGAAYSGIDTTRRFDKLGAWVWVKGTTRNLEAGHHVWAMWGDLFLYGGVIDRMVLTRDAAYQLKDEDPGPAATMASTIQPGNVTSEVINLKGVKEWRRILCREFPGGGKMRWAYKVEGTEAWQDIPGKDIRGIPAGSPFRIRMFLEPSPDRKSPIVDTVRLEYAGAPLENELSAGVRFRPLPNGGCVVATGSYEATFAPGGRITSLKLAGKELTVAGDSGPSGVHLEFNRQPVDMAPPDLTPDKNVAVRGEDATQLYSFKEDSLSVVLSTHGGKQVVGSGPLTWGFNLNPQLDVERTVERGTGKVIPKGEVAGNTPQIFLKDGASFYLVPCYPSLPAFINYFSGKDGPATVGFWLNTANIITDTMVFRPKPIPADVLQMEITCSKKDHTYALGEPVQVVVNSYLLYNLSYEGKARLTLTKAYADKGDEEVCQNEQKISIPAGAAKTPVAWKMDLQSPGLYSGKYEILEGDQSVRSLTFMVLYAPEKLLAPGAPKDFDAFWKKAMEDLAKVPVEHTVQSAEERDGYVLSRIEFKSIDGRPAWGNLMEPKEDGKYPAILRLPPVATQALGINLQKERGFVGLGPEIFGHDPRWSQEKINEFLAKGGMRYEPLEAKAKKNPREFWHFYAYCTIARAYDLLEKHPKVDKNRIYITGVSQGGGLTLAAAGLRPQNAGAVPVVPGLCRLDWVNSNGGAWGPRIPPGPDFEPMVEMLRYFDTAYLMKNIRSRMVIQIGLFDDHTPPHAAASVFNNVPVKIKERKLLICPWTAHESVPEIETYIPRWAGEDKPKDASGK